MISIGIARARGAGTSSCTALTRVGKSPPQGRRSEAPQIKTPGAFDASGAGHDESGFRLLLRPSADARPSRPASRSPRAAAHPCSLPPSWLPHWPCAQAALATTFFATAFLAAVGFFAAVLRTGFFATDFLAGAAFFATDFLAVPVAFFAAVLRAGFFAAAFFTGAAAFFATAFRATFFTVFFAAALRTVRLLPSLPQASVPPFSSLLALPSMSPFGLVLQGNPNFVRHPCKLSGSP